MSELDIIDLTNDSDTESSESDTEDAGLPLSDVSQTYLHLAIENTAEIKLRVVLAELADTNPAVAAALFKKLVTEKDGPVDQEGTDEESSETEATSDRDTTDDAEDSNSSHVEKLVICANCGDDYDAALPRELGECIYHTGRLKRNHGTFTWDCCCEDGDMEGCVEHIHVRGGSQKKRARYF